MLRRHLATRPAWIPAPASAVFAVVGAIGVIAAAAGAVSAEPPKLSGSVVGSTDGAEVYTKVCAYCHDQGVAPVLRGRQLPVPLVNLFVRNGNRSMPAFRSSEIDDATLAILADYISKN